MASNTDWQNELIVTYVSQKSYTKDFNDLANVILIVILLFFHSLSYSSIFIER